MTIQVSYKTKDILARIRGLVVKAEDSRPRDCGFES